MGCYRFITEYFGATRGLIILIVMHLLVPMASAALRPGDIAITGFNMDNPDEVAFIALTDLAEDETIHFTDNGWMASDSFRTGEGIMTYTIPAGGMAAGTIITQAVTSMQLSASGDQILLYQGEPSTPTFLYALNCESSAWQIDAANANESALPTGLINGYTAIAIRETDNAQFDFTVITSGTKSDWLTAISDPLNWSGDNATRFILPAESQSIQDSDAPNIPPLLDIEPPGTNIITEAEHPLLFDITATQLAGDETDLTTLNATSLPTGASFPQYSEAGTVTNAFSWTPSAAQTGLFTVGFVAYDKDGTNTMNVSIYVGAVTGTPPQWVQLDDQVTYLGQAIAFPVTANATEGDSVILSAQNLPPGASFSSTGTFGNFEWLAPTTTGTFIVTFVASDNDGTNIQDVTINVYEQRTIEFTSDNLTTEEKNNGNTLTIQLTGQEGTSVTLLTSGSATENIDYQLSTNTVSFLGSEHASVNLTILNDHLQESAETLTLTLTNATGSHIGTRNTQHIKIRDDDCFSVATANLGSQIAPTDTCYEDFAGRIFQGISADIVAVQEFNVTNRNAYVGYRDFVNQHFGTNFYYHVETEDIYGKMPNGIISRWPIIDAGEWKDSELFNRDFAWATVQIPGDRLLHVISIHIKAGDAIDDINRRIIEVQQLTNDIFSTFSTTNHIVLCGDFNLTDRDENTLQILTNAFPYTHTPKDQYGYKNTNKNRQNPFDWVMPSTLLDTYSITTHIDGVAFPEGAIFDSRLWETPPWPVQTNDSIGEGLQHMPVIRTFSFSPAASVEHGEALVTYTFDGEDSGTNTADSTHSNTTASAFDSADKSITYLQGEPSSGYAIRDTGWDSVDNYFSFTLTVENGYQAFIDSLQFDGLRGGTGPTRWAVRSSTDNFNTHLDSGDYAMADAWCTATIALGLDLITGDITFRLYGTDAETAYGNWRIDNVELLGTVNRIDPNDQDHDSIPDAWELTYFANLNVASKTSDADHDGASDWDEYIAGTLPDNPSSIFNTTYDDINKNTSTLSWPSSSNRTYSIYLSTNLTTGFAPLVTDIPATPPLNTHTTATSSASACFFQIIVTLNDN